MAMDYHDGRMAIPERVITWAALLVSTVGVTLFASVVGGIGEWVEGRQFQTVAPWAVPGLVLAVVAVLTAVRTLMADKGHRLALLLALSVALAVLLLFLINPSITPPVP